MHGDHLRNNGVTASDGTIISSCTTAASGAVRLGATVPRGGGGDDGGGDDCKHCENGDEVILNTRGLANYNRGRAGFLIMR